MHALLAYGLVCIAIILLIRRPRIGVLFTIATKPAIDTAWNTAAGGISALELNGVAVPIVVLGILILQRPYEFRRVPGGLAWALFVVANIVGFAIMLASGKAYSAIEMFFRVLNGFAGYYMLHPFIRTERDFKHLLIALIIAGMVPTMFGIYQAITGHVWSYRHTVGLLRNVGIYHDVFAMRSYGYLSLAGVILYSIYFARTMQAKIILLLYGAMIGTVIFKVYSKAAIVIAGVWLTIWSIFRKRFHALILVTVLVSIVGVFFHNAILSEVETLFSKETAALEGVGDEKRVLGGRAHIWGPAFEEWYEADVFNQLFGMGKSGGSSHNDFLRVTISGGIIALLTYIMLLIVIGIRVFKKALLSPEPINIMALMIFVMWMIDTIGLTPGIYPGYQWYVWGFIGLALRGIDWQSEKNMKIAKNS